MALRDYQTATLEALERDFAAGFTDLLAVLATGGGKTNIALEFIHRNVGPGERALWIAHREELITQPVDRMVGTAEEPGLHPEWGPDTGIVMGKQNECAARLVCATVQ